jgi:hypothetical protein
MFALAWNDMIPERLTTPTFLWSQLFALPMGCCSLIFLTHAQVHETGWRLLLSAGVTFANGIVWAWCIDWFWRRYVKRSTTRGFPVVKSGSGERPPG